MQHLLWGVCSCRANPPYFAFQIPSKDLVLPGMKLLNSALHPTIQFLLLKQPIIRLKPYHMGDNQQTVNH